MSQSKCYVAEINFVWSMRVKKKATRLKILTTLLFCAVKWIDKRKACLKVCKQLPKQIKYNKRYRRRKLTSISWFKHELSTICIGKITIDNDYCLSVCENVSQTMGLKIFFPEYESSTFISLT